MTSPSVISFYGAPSSVYVPECIVAGDTTKWQVGFTDYDASAGWSCTFHLKGAGALAVATIASGSNFNVTLSSAASTTLTAGTYTYAYVMTKSGETYTANSGRVEVKASIAGAVAGDLVSYWSKLKDAAQSALIGKVTDDALSLSYYGKTVNTLPPDVLIKLIGLCEYNLYRETTTSRHFGKPVTTVHTKLY